MIPPISFLIVTSIIADQHSDNIGNLTLSLCFFCFRSLYEYSIWNHWDCSYIPNISPK